MSVAAPGAGPSQADCAHGDFSTIPVSTNTTEWDDASDSCNNVFQPDTTPGAGRWAYGEGTSFSAPIVSAVAALVRQANPVLTPAQVADVIRRSATQTFGTGWNEYTGAGIVNANAAVAVARTYDTTPPTAVFTAVPKVGGIQADLTATDVADPGKTVAGGVTLTLEESRDGVDLGHRRAGGPRPGQSADRDDESRVAPLDRVRRRPQLRPAGQGPAHGAAPRPAQGASARCT